MLSNHDEDKTDIETVGLRGWCSPDCDKGINGLKSVNLIAGLVKHLPNKPGVYRMLGENGDVLYVGKARNLKKRVANYTRLENNTKRIARMIRLTNKMEFIVTHSEAEALLLEADLIKKLLPRFNILLRHDKSFPYIVITDNHHAPGIFTHRGARARGGAYFGPFASAGAANDMISDLQRAFLLRTCKDSVYETRTRPCLLYQIKRCSAPCTNTISREDYEQLVTQTKAFLSGNSRIIKSNMTEDMNEAAEKMDFERAAFYRDRLAALSHGPCDPGFNPRTIDDADVFAIRRNDGLTSVQVLFFRGGQSRENRVYFPNAEPSRPMSDVLEVFLAQFYHNKPIPGLILLSAEIAEHALLTKALKLKTGHKVQIITPRRGEKKQLVQYALAKAGEALARRLAEKRVLMPNLR